MADRIAITGMGVVSALGLNADENLRALLSGKSGISSIQILDTIHKADLPAGEIHFKDEELAQKLGFELNDQWTRTSLLGLLAAKEAFEHSKIGRDENAKIGIVSATTVAGMRKSEQFYGEFISKGTSEEFIGTHDAGDSTEKIANFLGIKDYLTSISTACSSSTNSIMLGARLLNHKVVDKVLVGGTDSLSKFTMNGFNSLMILDKEPCRSFDDTRAGLNLGEGAAFLVLERASEVQEKPILAYVAGYANANDAFHQTASSPEGKGASLAMSRALKMANLNPSEIDYINAHGTATLNNDLSEGLAIEAVFGNEIPLVSSTKPFTGHTLAAAGSIEAVFSILSMQEQVVFPNLNFTTQMKELNFKPVTKLLKDKKIRTILSNSFGFGGNNSSVIFSKD
ncbi:MAG: beta-ketoacyl-[acyl-carrier-protein] synthase family protein [Bacteroidales bacterium]|nr:beta-ketoacyl-[acyl-carrier-protein] synthase family protein [Bacteroidales bacterium]